MTTTVTLPDPDFDLLRAAVADLAVRYRQKADHATDDEMSGQYLHYVQRLNGILERLREAAPPNPAPNPPANRWAEYERLKDIAQDETKKGGDMTKATVYATLARAEALLLAACPS